MSASTWSDLLGWVDAVAEDLHRGGVRHGERVAVWLPNRVEAVIVLLACSRNGYVCNPSLHQNYRVAEIMTLLERIDAAALFAQTGHGADAERADVFAAAGKLASLRRVYRLEPRGANRQAQAAPQASFPGRDNGIAVSVPPDPNPDKVIYLAFTSGTTGTPKGVMHSDNTLLTNGRAMVRDWGHDEQDRAGKLESREPSHRHGRAGADACRRLRAGGQRSRRRA